MRSRLATEGVGTFVLVFFGVGTAVFGADRVGAVGVALAFGLVLLAPAYALGPVSGCHVNPAVTLSRTDVAGGRRRRPGRGHEVAETPRPEQRHHDPTGEGRTVSSPSRKVLETWWDMGLRTWPVERRRA